MKKILLLIFFSSIIFGCTFCKKEEKVITVRKELYGPPGRPSPPGTTPLHSVASYGDDIEDIKEVKRLIKEGADVNAVTEYGRETPLHWAAGTGIGEIARILIENGANVNAKDVNDWMPIHHAADYANVGVLKILLEEKKVVNVKGEDGDTPLHIILANFNEENALNFLKLLLDAGADPNTQNNHGITPFLISTTADDIIEKDRLYVVELLLKKGGDPYIKSKRGETAFSIAKENNKQKLIKLFETYTKKE